MSKLTDKTRVQESKRLFPATLFSAMIGGFVLALSKPVTLTGLFDKRKDFYSSCSRCNYCFQNCPVNAIVYDGRGFPHITKEKCISWNPRTKKLDWELCGICLRGCPTQALDHLNRDTYKTDREDDSVKTTIMMTQ